ncbi:c-type cytochrome [Dankookia rubra]|uniref:c-type cytochrome n=1 Tax=Dankookia rubra TaxID=1442381 RepID=UPI0018783596|nr:cytochrome c [Dankookia rubra]
MRPMLALAVLLPALASAEEPARQERLNEGRRVAEAWCADCHVIGPRARGPAGDAAPPFAAVAAMPSTTAMSLRAFLQTPHSRMPDYRLTQAELDGVVTWILAQKPR